MSLEDYAMNILPKSYITFCEICKTLLDGLDCVVAKESVADLLGYSNGGFRNKIIVYSKENINKPYLECIIVNNFDNLDIINHNGILCTSINKAIVDMLLDNNTDSQVLLETLSNYYYENNKEFNNLKVPYIVQRKFKNYLDESKRYYEI